MWPLLRIWFGSKEALRLVCVIAVAGWLIAVAVFVVSLLSVAYRDETVMQFLFSAPGLMAILLTAGAASAANLVLMFSRCARCSKLLFDDDRQRLIDAGAPDIRHHRAKTFLNSYRRGAIVQLAFTGRLNCSRCGHELGTKPDYVVVAPE